MKEVTAEDHLFQRVNLSFYFFVKRLFDLIFGFFGILLCIPLALIIKIVSIYHKDYAPIFFKQERIGKDGKLFYLYKFRSMVPNAESILNQWLMEENNDLKDEYLQNKKLVKDPRITKVGKFLRKTSLDEFPQFINVFLGEMSMIGPRPYLPREKNDIGDAYYKIIKVKPGLSGPWQVNGRSNIGFQRRVAIEEDYAENKSLWFDFKIVCKTVIQVIKKDGAK